MIMQNRLKITWMILLFVSAGGMAHATPSTTYWTPAIIDIQSFGVVHAGVDNYFSAGKNSQIENNPVTAFPTDMGLTMGVLPFEKIQMEIGIDVLEPQYYPVLFNAKIGAPEDTLFKYCPAIQFGLFDVGIHTKNNTKGGAIQPRNDYNIMYGLIGKTIPYLGRIHGGYYYGNKGALVDGNGNKGNNGFMLAFDHGFFPVKNEKGEDEYNKVVLAADYASGKNYIGGGGFGIYYFFTKDISLLAGPVWFNDETINGKWKITVQLDVNIDLFGKN